MIAWVRTALFYLVFYALSVPIVLAVPVTALFGQRAIVAHAVFWTRVHRWALHAILGIRIRVEGARPDEPAFYASKHQAMFETVELVALLHGPAMVMKQELTRIPIWGWATRRYGAIPVDRDASAQALRGMMRGAKAARAERRSVLIFPEGTRVAPGERPALKPGFAGLYRMLDMPTVPIACDSGVLMPRGRAKRAGTITIRFGAPIPPGLPRREVEARVHAAINALEPGGP